ncbi:signal peptidase I [Bacillus alkalicellulosilyticus]|uniref:signal peptidase I n=1 Tax=Alkalihalobacterium alkalicellulosilyticum TaxID=1912214 RepID=UPI000998239E|nr:signal peptidase I [Bacillus alkalicellulosilyticus]
MKKSMLFQELFSWSKVILAALVLSLIISSFVIQPYSVSGSSMEPTFDGENPFDEDSIGDRVIIFKSGYLLGQDPSYLDLVIIDSRTERKRSITDNFLESPMLAKLLREDEDEKEDEHFWIKRVIGEPGDRLEGRDGKIFRNGIELTEEYIKDEMVYSFEEFVVPEQHVFVMGDNRNHSIDSRDIGPVPIDNVVGKVILRYYPFTSFTSY